MVKKIRTRGQDLSVEIDTHFSRTIERKGTNAVILTAKEQSQAMYLALIIMFI